ncbi:aspartate-semialdehyde dehydrogenase [Carboxydochorda subterranea]|uniref:Aspartate-semialdehyde dehydrogenase n=1 Tax=Carboxydichorda subterranea TaxID=3109565 RepID=A0ABZ1BZX3_9FIRM|nr:aspartate-semialdehyde dehydrogenase [Limnochorda sp. L945t]WRP18357.1 aspartate-semialdehyde dehydrogenase [Limnochorda sp. L945t]
MAQGVKVGVVGATGAVGQEFLKILEERRWKLGDLRLFASERSAGKTVRVLGETFSIEAATPSRMEGLDLLFFSAGASVSRELAPQLARKGAVVIDNSSAFRMDPDVPLVVPEVNGQDAFRHRGIVANPNCSTIIMAVPLWPLHRAAGIRRVVVSTYQAVSGAGARAMAELEEELRAHVRGETYEPAVLPYASAERHYPIAFNVIPQVDRFEEAGYTKEEWKMVRETRKIFHEPELAVTATTVRVPVLRSHSESINVELARPLSAEEARALLREAPGVEVVDDPERQRYPMPLEWSGKDAVAVGRIREDLSRPGALNLWAVGDQIRKGAALNAVQIAQVLGLLA